MRSKKKSECFRHFVQALVVPVGSLLSKFDDFCWFRTFAINDNHYLTSIVPKTY